MHPLTITSGCLADWLTGIHYNAIIWPYLVGYAVVIVVGIAVVVLAAIGIRRLLRNRRNRLDNA